MSAPSRFFQHVALVSLLALIAPLAQAQAQASAEAPRSQSAPIKDRYIIVFKKDVADPEAEARTLLRGVANGQLHHVYGSALKGFAATLPAQAL